MIKRCCLLSVFLSHFFTFPSILLQPAASQWQLLSQKAPCPLCFRAPFFPVRVIDNLFSLIGAEKSCSVWLRQTSVDGNALRLRSCMCMCVCMLRGSVFRLFPVQTPDSYQREALQVVCTCACMSGGPSAIKRHQNICPTVSRQEGVWIFSWWRRHRHPQPT